MQTIVDRNKSKTLRTHGEEQLVSISDEIYGSIIIKHSRRQPWQGSAVAQDAQTRKEEKLTASWQQIYFTSRWRPDEQGKGEQKVTFAPLNSRKTKQCLDGGLTSFSAGQIKLGKVSPCCCDCLPDSLHSPSDELPASSPAVDCFYFPSSLSSQAPPFSGFSCFFLLWSALSHGLSPSRFPSLFFRLLLPPSFSSSAFFGLDHTYLNYCFSKFL